MNSLLNVEIHLLFVGLLYWQSKQSPLPSKARLARPSESILFPRVTYLICWLLLPTLTYRLEAIHLGDLLQIWVRALPKVRKGGSGPMEGAFLRQRWPDRSSVKDVRELTTLSEATSSLREASVLWPWVSALAYIFKDRRRCTVRCKNRSALRYHDPIVLRVASRVTES